MKHILIINQHGENRGDEAAMRAMLAGFREELGDVRFTLLYQFKDRSLRLSFREQVKDLPIVLPPLDYMRALLYSATNLVRIDLKSVLSSAMRPIIDAYRSADLVVSAPGGPYFGDIYINHEIVHWWYVWLAIRFNKPLFLYAPSAGPFESKLMNPIRRRLYKKFDVLVTREEISQKFLQDLLGEQTKVHVTADSAIQQSFQPLERSRYFRGERATLADKFLVAVSLNNYRYPGAPNPGQLREEYNRSMLGLIEHLARRKDCHFLLVPQLYGAAHSDAPFLLEIGAKLSPDVSFEVVEPETDSDTQRRLFAMADLHVASRYHPAIFGHMGYTPGICIYYEHKALGFMKQLGLERFAFDIREPRLDRLCQAADELLEQREQIIAHLGQRVPALQKRARRTTDLAVELLKSREAARRVSGLQK